MARGAWTDDYFTPTADRSSEHHHHSSAMFAFSPGSPTTTSATFNNNTANNTNANNTIADLASTSPSAGRSNPASKSIFKTSLPLVTINTGNPASGTSPHSGGVGGVGGSTVSAVVGSQSPTATATLVPVHRSLSDGDLTDYLKGFFLLKDRLLLAKQACDQEVQTILDRLPEYPAAAASAAQYHYFSSSSSASALSSSPSGAGSGGDGIAVAGSNRRRSTSRNPSIVGAGGVRAESPVRLLSSGGGGGGGGGSSSSDRMAAVSGERAPSASSLRSSPASSVDSFDGVVGVGGGGGGGGSGSPRLESLRIASSMGAGIGGFSSTSATTTTSRTKRSSLVTSTTADELSSISRAAAEIRAIAQRILRLDLLALIHPGRWSPLTSVHRSIHLSLYRSIDPTTCLTRSSILVGTCVSVIQTLQTLQYHWPNDWPAHYKLLTTKLLLAFSPVARLVEHLEQDIKSFQAAEDQSSNNNSKPGGGKKSRGPRQSRSATRGDASSSNYDPPAAKRHHSPFWGFLIADEHQQQQQYQQQQQQQQHSGERSPLPPSDAITANDLHAAVAEGQMLNVILEVASDGTIQYISPSCKFVFG